MRRSQGALSSASGPALRVAGGGVLVVVVLIQIGILRYAYLAIGVSSRAAMALLLGSLIGSYINIPVLELPKRAMPLLRPQIPANQAENFVTQ